jgi:hypothetical protein
MKKKLLLIIFFIGLYIGWKLFSLCIQFNKYQKISAKLPDLEVCHIEPATAAFEFPDKIWLHRVNSLERAKLMSGKYEGMELDITFDTLKNTFDVGHPPSPSIGLTLDDYFSNIPSISTHAFWLDFKNLREDNKMKAFHKLVSLVNTYQIKNRIIIESQNAGSLDIFTNAGFYTSYYVPVFDIQISSVEEIKKHYFEIINTLKSTRVCALSASSSQLGFLEKYFPDYDKLIWHLDESRSLSFYAAQSWLIRKTKVKVVLINENGAGFR